MALETSIPAAAELEAIPGEATRIVIEALWPQIDGGRYPIKRVAGDTVEVHADIFRDGHDLLAAVLKYRRAGEDTWREAPMQPVDNDRWSGSFWLEDTGRWEFTVAAWTDDYGSWHRDMQKRVAAYQDVTGEVKEGHKLAAAALKRATGDDRAALATGLDSVENGGFEAALQTLMDSAFTALVRRYPDRSSASEYAPALGVYADRERARFSSWYELFPRSYSPEPGKHGTFRDAAARLPAVRDLGFDIVYLPPIHPIGTTNRKGPNNTLVAEPGDVGSPWAIGSAEGGHDAIHPELGSAEDFDFFVKRTRELGMEVALDFAIQCSPDHPWVTEHTEWFFLRADETIRFAENPPKKYEDIYPVNFYGPDQQALWNELLRIVRLWVGRGVRVFRVDNPHTKSVPFWGWLIDKVQRDDPGVLFLAEAFTRPKMMRALAKAGFTQSYTYFTWRNTKWELTDYLLELTQSEMREYYRPNFWPNTPDILHEFLQEGGLPAFRLRLLLAATLSSNYGMYSGYELAENVPVRPGSEEYLDSEKYQLRQRDWNQPHSIAPLIARVNRIRHEHPALQHTNNLRFVQADSEAIIAYAKQSPDRGDTILTVVNLDPHHAHETLVHVPASLLGLPTDGRPFIAEDLLNGARYVWRDGANYVRLDPSAQAGHIFWLYGEEQRWDD